jgi:hypothetical protein
MKDLKTAVSLFLTAAGVMGVLYSCQSPGGPATGNHQEKLYGYLYNQDGQPAANARVSLVRSSYVPAASLPKTAVSASADGLTDKNGRYSFSYVPADTYNLFGEGNGNLSYQPSVPVNADTTPEEVPNDTLEPTGGIQGIVSFDPPADGRKVLISLQGSNFVCWPYDSAGHFIMNNLPAVGGPGVGMLYRFCPIDQDYITLDTILSVSQGTITDLGKINLFKWNAGPLGALRLNYLAMKFGIMVHFNMSTFDRCCCPECYSVSGEWGLANRDQKIFNPGSLNCGQWADAAKTAGANYMILTVKHHDGFCLWPSKSTGYCVTKAACTTDVVRQFVDSARARGLQVGFYYSIRDLTNGISMDFIKSQLTELLSNYGPVICLYFDGWGWGAGYKKVSFVEIDSLVKSLQPNCLVIDNNHEYNFRHSEIVEYEMPIDGPPKEGNYLSAEGFEPIRADKCWFWHPNRECDLMPPQIIVDHMNQCNSRNANYLLNVCPDTTGRLPQCQVDSLKAVGALRGIQ